MNARELQQETRSKQASVETVLCQGENGPLDFPTAWQLAQDVLGSVVAANEFSLGTISNGRWQAFFGVWHQPHHDFYRVSRIALLPEEAIFLAARDLWAVIRPEVGVA